MIRSLLGRLVGVDALRAWTREQLKGVRERVTAAEKPTEATLAKVKTLEKALALAERKSESSREAFEAQRKEMAGLTKRLARLERLAQANNEPGRPARPADPAELATTIEHARKAIRSATLERDPGPHVVIDNVLPQPIYDRLIAALPPEEFFAGEGAKSDFRIHSEALAPRASLDAWEAFETDIVGNVLMPALLDLFAPVLAAHYAHLLGPELAEEAVGMPKRASGRIMLRRPGYFQGPHVDPKRALVTGILYLARPGDNEAHGTQLYAADRTFVSPSNTTYYLEPDGIQCQVAKRILYRPNRILAFLNSVAHGAEYPPDAGPRHRYAYQFYVKPKDEALGVLLGRLPAEKRVLWKGVI